MFYLLLGGFFSEKVYFSNVIIYVLDYFFW